MWCSNDSLPPPGFSSELGVSFLTHGDRYTPFRHTMPLSSELSSLVDIAMGLVWHWTFRSFQNSDKYEVGWWLILLQGPWKNHNSPFFITGLCHSAAALARFNKSLQSCLVAHCCNEHYDNVPCLCTTGWELAYKVKCRAPNKCVTNIHHQYIRLQYQHYLLNTAIFISCSHNTQRKQIVHSVVQFTLKALCCIT